MLADYRTTNLSVGPHPLQLLRPLLPKEVISTEELLERRHGDRVAIAGLAVARQRPATANGVVFMLLEDELGLVNLVVQPKIYERFRALVRGEPLLLARGRLEQAERNRNVVVDRLESLGPLAREAAGLVEIRADLPRAHHFGRGRR
jgi:error-prone DNA polymerase